jgi:hypothetical protein
MKYLDDIVRDTVEQFVQDGLLFTGLDVSNKVKEEFPYARHSAVSDLVRGSFVSHMEPCGYAKTPISVTLRDGSVRTALLYHPLADSWDLDNKYDVQKRAQVSVNSVTTPVLATVSSNGTVTVSANQVTVAAPSVAAAPVVPPPPPVVSPAAAWSQLFNSQPSLFPLK